MEKYLYFRTEATDANDDASGDSVCFPASSLKGMQPTADSVLTLYFESLTRRHPSGNEPDADELFDNHDKVLLNLTTANTHLTAIKAIVSAIGKAKDNSLIIVANDDSGGTEYLANSGITSCGNITIHTAYAN